MASAFELLLLTQVNNLLNNTPQLIQAVQVGTNTPSVALTVPSGYKRMAVYWRVRSTVAAAGEQLYVQFNGDTSNHYLWEVNQANNATTTGGQSGGLVAFIQVATVNGATAPTGYFASGNFVVDGVADATNFASVVGSGTVHSSGTNAWTGTYGGMWANAGPITSMTLHCSSGSIVGGSSFSMYGMQ